MSSQLLVKKVQLQLLGTTLSDDQFEKFIESLSTITHDKERIINALSSDNELVDKMTTIMTKVIGTVIATVIARNSNSNSNIWEQ